MANVSIAERTNTSCPVVNNWIRSLSISFSLSIFPLALHCLYLGFFYTASLSHISFMLSKDLHFTDRIKKCHPPLVIYSRYGCMSSILHVFCTSEYLQILQCSLLQLNKIVLTKIFLFYERKQRTQKQGYAVIKIYQCFATLNIYTHTDFYFYLCEDFHW